MHEDPDQLSPASLDRHRALMSLQEELEAIDWYDQRIEAAEDTELARVLRHNRDEETEHAAMLLEWLRRRDGVLDLQLRRHLFDDVPVDGPVGPERAGPASPLDASLAIGSLSTREMA